MEKPVMVNRDTFRAVFIEELNKARAEHPEKYGWRPGITAEIVADRYLETMGEIDGIAMRATCKRLKIKRNIKSIMDYLYGRN